MTHRGSLPLDTHVLRACLPANISCFILKQQDLLASCFCSSRWFKVELASPGQISEESAGVALSKVRDAGRHLHCEMSELGSNNQGNRKPPSLPFTNEIRSEQSFSQVLHETASQDVLYVKTSVNWISFLRIYATIFLCESSYCYLDLVLGKIKSMQE